MPHSFNIEPFILSLQLAGMTTAILFVLCLPIAWCLTLWQSRCKPFIEAIIALPIVLPPSVMGFYLLYLFSANSTIGGFLQHYFDFSLIFSFEGLVVASCVYSLPFMMQPLQSGLESLPKSLIESAYTMGKNRWQTLLFIALPNIKPSLITATVITFAHTIGEFGVVLMIGGSIPQETKVASIAIYEMVEMMDYANAHYYSAILLILSFVVLFIVYGVCHRSYRKW